MTFFSIKNRLSFTPFFFGFLYLFLIPLYAFLYYKMPNNFYQSTINYEKMVTGWQIDPEINYSLVQELCDSINKNYTRFTGKKYIVTNNNDTLNGLLITLDENRIRVVNDNMFFPLLFPQSNNHWVMVYLSVKVNNGNLSSLGFEAENEVREITIDTVYDKNQNNLVEMLNYNLWDFFPYPSRIYQKNNTSKKDNFGYIKISKSIQKKINNISTGLNIDNSLDDYWKMFYFSSVTITTLGLGDIVPITQKARILVASEAILGIIIIGLFLNSLANKIKRK